VIRYVFPYLLTSIDAVNIITHATTLRQEMVPLANETGKRYFCSKCGAEFIVTKGGEGTIACHGQPLTKK